MQLRLYKLAKCLNTTPDTVERWIRQGRIPVRKKGNQCIYNSTVLKKWANENNLSFVMPETASEKTPKKTDENLYSAMKRGGVLYEIPGDSVEDALSAAVNQIDCLHTVEQQKTLLQNLVARETLMSTGIGNGIAIPHPRKPLPYKEIPAFITTCFLRNRIDFHAVDNKPVYVMFIIACPTSKLHLYLLSRLSFCLQNDEFTKLLSDVPDPDTFFTKVQEFQKGFDSTG